MFDENKVINKPKTLEDGFYMVSNYLKVLRESVKNNSRFFKVQIIKGIPLWVEEPADGTPELKIEDWDLYYEVTND